MPWRNGFASDQKFLPHKEPLLFPKVCPNIEKSTKRDRVASSPRRIQGGSAGEVPMRTESKLDAQGATTAFMEEDSVVPLRLEALFLVASLSCTSMGEAIAADGGTPLPMRAAPEYGEVYGRFQPQLTRGDTEKLPKRFRIDSLEGEIVYHFSKEGRLEWVGLNASQRKADCARLIGSVVEVVTRDLGPPGAHTQSGSQFETSGSTRECFEWKTKASSILACCTQHTPLDRPLVWMSLSIVHSFVVSKEWDPDEAIP